MRLLTRYLCFVRIFFLLAYIMSKLRKIPEDFPLFPFAAAMQIFLRSSTFLLTYSYRPDACAYTCPLIRANALPRIQILTQSSNLPMITVLLLVSCMPSTGTDIILPLLDTKSKRNYHRGAASSPMSLILND